MAASSFKTQVAVHAWLDENGWQISKSQLNLHCRDGLLRKNKESKTYLLADVKKYAKLNLKRADTGQRVDDYEERVRREKMDLALQREKLALEEEKHKQAKRHGKVVPRDEVELAIVSRAVAFMAHLNHTVQTNAADWIDLVGGEQKRAPELVEAISQAIEQRMGDFAADLDIEVVLEQND